MIYPSITNIETGYCTRSQPEAQLTFHVDFCNLQQGHNFLSLPLAFSLNCNIAILAILVFTFFIHFVILLPYFFVFFLHIFASTSRLITFYGFLRPEQPEKAGPPPDPHPPNPFVSLNISDATNCCHSPSFFVIPVSRACAKYILWRKGGA